MDMKAFVILNPVAGQTDPKQVVEILDAARSEGRLTFDIYETTGKENLKKIVGERTRGDYDLVIASGGDGTMSAVADGLANSGVPLGILPTGTANSFATALNIPEALEDALKLIYGKHQVKLVDAIQFRDRFFILEVSLGVFSASFDDVKREKKDRLGWFAYVDTALRNWIGLDPLSVSVEVDGEHYMFRASEVALFNTSQVGIINQDLDEDIHLDDGVLDLYVLHSKALWDVLLTLFYRVLGKPKKAPHTRHWLVKSQIRIETDPCVAFQADGDVQGKTPAVFKIAPGVLQVCVSENAAEKK
jgi:diacylglycerol kinase (ATP)